MSFVRESEYYDLHVPLANHYSAHGLWHHNSGKSWAGAYDLLRRARPGRLYMAVAPTYPMMRDASLRTFLALARDLNCLRGFARSEMTATLGNRAEVLFRSADDPDRLRGPNLSGVWLDEASLMAREAWDVIIGRLREAGEEGWASATFTPKGRSHWTYDVFGREPGPGVALFHAPTRANPFLPRGFETTLRQQYAGLLARQELEGLFLEIAGAEWPAEYFPDSMWFDDWPAKTVAKVISLDPSKGRADKPGDYSALVLAALTPDGHVWIDADLQRRPTPRIVEDGLAHHLAFKASAFCVEINQFQELLAHDFGRLARERGIVLPLYGVTNTEAKVVRIRRLGPYLARGELHFRRGSPGASLLVDQLASFPEGDHDDGPDALEVSLRMLGHLVGQRGTPGQPTILRA